MLQILVSLWPLFAIILGGLALRRSGFPGDDFWPGAERINYFILFPALLLRNLATAPLANPALPRLALAVVLVLALAWIALLLVRRGRGWPPARFGVHAQGTIRFNTYIGLATTASLLGPAGVTQAAMLLAVTVPTVNVLSVHAFAGSGLRWRALLPMLAKNPLILACLAGTLANIAGLPLAGGLDQLLGLLAATSLPLGLLCVGAALQPQELKSEVGSLAGSAAVRLLAVPALAFAAARLLDLPPTAGAVLVIFFALPTAPTSYVLTRQLGGDAHLMAGIITFQTLAAALTLPLVLRLVV
jgi:malonate transporter and related proteins